MVSDRRAVVYDAAMKRHAVLGVYGAMLLACGSDPVEYAELESVCGAPSPLRILELASDEVVRAGESLRVQDRVLYVVRRLDKDDPDALYSTTAESTVWSMGPCGESPVQLATGIDDIFMLPRWPDVVLGCEKATGNIVVLDPTGAAQPHIVFPGVPQDWTGCGLNWTDFGLLSLEEHDDEFGALSLYPYPDDPRTGTSAPAVLIDPIRIGPSNGGGPGYRSNVLYTYADEALVLTPEDLVRIDLADGSASTLQPSVAAVSASRNGQLLLWQDAAITKDHPEYPEGKIFLRDRSTGSDVLLGETALRYSGLSLFRIEQGLIQLALGALDKPLRIFFVPGLEFVDVAGDLLLNAQLADGRWVGSSLFGGYLDLIDLPSNASTRLFPRKARVFGHDDDAVYVLEGSGDLRNEGAMWRVPLDGSAMTKLADRATRFMARLEDGRLLGPVGAGAFYLASLVLVEPETRNESRIDDHVHFYSIDASRIKEEGIVSYSVADGERSGLYLARLPAVE